MSTYIINHLLEFYSVIASIAAITILILLFIKINTITLLSAELKTKDTLLTEKNSYINKLNDDIHQLNEYNIENLSAISSLRTELKNSYSNESIIKNIINEITEDSRQKLSEHSHNNLEIISKSLKEKIESFQKKIEDSNKGATEERIRLEEHIKSMFNLTKEVNNSADNLAKALKGEKIKQIGNWGEFQLESILQFHNLEEGINYYKEAKDFALYREGEVTRERPDFIIKLPNDKHIIIDAKTTIGSYQLYHDAEEENKEHYLINFKNDIRRHIDDLAKKAYHNIDNLNTPEFTLMFIPIEAAFLLIMQDNNSLFEYALKKNILITSPTTLFAVLKTYGYIIKNDQKIQNIQEIMKTAEELYSMIAVFCSELEKVGISIDNAKLAYKEAILRFQGKGKGATITYQANKLKRLGLSPKKEHNLLKGNASLLDNLIED